MNKEDFEQGLNRAWKHWQDHKEDIDYFGFRDWMLYDYGIRYGSSATDVQMTFEKPEGKLRFFLEWM